MSAHNFLATRDNAMLIDTIKDPGDAGAIGILKSGLCKLVTAGAETRTLADPKAPGLEIQLSLMTDEGDCVITVASGFNASGNTTLTFDAVGDTVVLRSAPISATAYVWREMTAALGGAAPS